MTIPLIAITIVGVALSLAWFLRDDPHRRSEAFVSLLITLAGTFAGVFLAITMSNLQADRADVNQLISLLDQAAAEVASQETLLTPAAEGILLPGQDTVADRLRENPVPPLATLELVIGSPVFARRGQLLTRSLLIEARNLEKIRVNLNSDAAPPERRKAYLGIYMRELWHVRGILSIGIAHLEGELDEEELQGRLEDLAAEKVFGPKAD